MRLGEVLGCTLGELCWRGAAGGVGHVASWRPLSFLARAFSEAARLETAWCGRSFRPSCLMFPALPSPVLSHYFPGLWNSRNLLVNSRPISSNSVQLYTNEVSENDYQA